MLENSQLCIWPLFHCTSIWFMWEQIQSDEIFLAMEDCTCVMGVVCMMKRKRPHGELNWDPPNREWTSGWMDGWINEQMGGWMGRGNISCCRPSTDDKRSPLQLSQVDPHLCTVARLPHPNLEEKKTATISQYSHLENMHSKVAVTGKTCQCKPPFLLALFIPFLSQC